MRKRFLRLSRKLEYRLGVLYTWLLRSSLKSCGEGVQLHFRLRLEEPGSISLGAGTMIYPRSWINAVSEWAGTRYNGEVRIGERVKIGYGTQISAAQLILIEDDVTIAQGVVIVDHIHNHRHIETSVFEAPLSTPAPVHIGKNSFLGVYCFIGPGVQIGEHAVVAANAVVVKDVPSYCVAAGNPARIVRYHSPEVDHQSAVELEGGLAGNYRRG
jgi:acetyltransferase-like isoleucine patch superfamily enzyme